MIVRGYCRNKDQESILRFMGLTARDIYREGYMGETLAACFASFREQRGMLIVATPCANPIQIEDIEIVGIPPTIFDEITAIMKAMRSAPTLRRMFAAL